MLMRNSWTLIVLLFAVPAAAESWQDGVFPVQTHDFGSVAVASETEYYFPVVNTFSSPLHIKDIRASCGCTTPTAIDETIPPGQSGSIRAKFNTDTFRGKKGATLTVVIDQPFYSEARLRVDGYIRSDIVFHPGKVDFGSVPTGGGASQTNKVLYAGRDDWKILDITSNRKWIQPSHTETSRGGGRINYDLTVTLAPDAPEGFFQDEITVITNDSKMPRVPLRVTGRVESILTVTPASIAAGTVEPGQPLVKRVVIIAKEPVAITGMTADDWDITLPESTDTKKSHILSPTFTYTASATGPVTSEITIQTDRDNLQKTFTLNATITPPKAD